MSYNAAYDPEGFRIRCVSGASVEMLKRYMHEQGFACFDLDQCFTKNQFLETLRRATKLPCTENSLTSWDSAADYLWQAMMEQPRFKVAIFWHSVDTLFSDGLPLLSKGLEFLLSVADVVGRQEEDVDCHPVYMQIYLAGEGHGFPVLKTEDIAIFVG